jgi:hypothetical protein
LGEEEGLGGWGGVGTWRKKKSAKGAAPEGRRRRM